VIEWRRVVQGVGLLLPVLLVVVVVVLLASCAPTTTGSLCANFRTAGFIDPVYCGGFR
jgi:cytochrome c oxidase subunit IV